MGKGVDTRMHGGLFCGFESGLVGCWEGNEEVGPCVCLVVCCFALHSASWRKKHIRMRICVCPVYWDPASQQTDVIRKSISWGKKRKERKKGKRERKRKRKRKRNSIYMRCLYIVGLSYPIRSIYNLAHLNCHSFAYIYAMPGNHVCIQIYIVTVTVSVTNSTQLEVPMYLSTDS